jgi:hypothetical protein
VVHIYRDRPIVVSPSEAGDLRLVSTWVDVAQFGRVLSLPGDDAVGSASLNYTVRPSRPRRS